MFRELLVMPPLTAQGPAVDKGRTAELVDGEHDQARQGVDPRQRT